MFNLTPVVKNILIINLVLFVFTLYIVDIRGLFGLSYIFDDTFYIFQYVSYMWLHHDWWHLISNMFAVFVFGPMLERVWGAKKFLIFYLITGIGAGILFSAVDTGQKWEMKTKAEQFQVNPNPEEFYFYIHKHVQNNQTKEQLSDFADEYYDAPENPEFIRIAKIKVQEIYDAYSKLNLVGASGALYGILMAFGMLFPNTQLILLFPPIPVKAKYLVLFYGLYSLYAEISQSGGNVAHLAHLSGMLIAFILLKYWARNGRSFY